MEVAEELIYGWGLKVPETMGVETEGKRTLGPESGIQPVKGPTILVHLKPTKMKKFKVRWKTKTKLVDKFVP